MKIAPHAVRTVGVHKPTGQALHGVDMNALDQAGPAIRPQRMPGANGQFSTQVPGPLASAAPMGLTGAMGAGMRVQRMRPNVRLPTRSGRLYVANIRRPQSKSLRLDSHAGHLDVSALEPRQSAMRREPIVLDPALQRVIARARADNPDLSFVIGSGARSAHDQDLRQDAGIGRGYGQKRRHREQSTCWARMLDLVGPGRPGPRAVHPGQQQRHRGCGQDGRPGRARNLNWGGDWQNFKDAPHCRAAGRRLGRPRPSASAASAPQPAAASATPARR